MTRTHVPDAEQRLSRRRPAPGRSFAWSAVLGLLLLAAALRMYDIDRAYELFIDEITYTDISTSIAGGNGVRLHGEPFYLHPPGVFLVLAGVLRAAGLKLDELATLTYQMRFVPALFGSVTPAVVLLIVRGATGRWSYALSAGAVLALDPFLIRFDSRVLLEAQAMSFAALGVLGLAWLVRRQRHHGPRAWEALPVGFLLFGSLISKETYASVAVLPVLVLLVTGLVVPRRTSARVLGTVFSCYAVYVMVIVLNGEFVDWFDSKTSGIRRLLGLSQVTGFNSAGQSVGLVDRLLVKLGDFGVTYSVIGLGVLSTLWLVLLLRRGGTVPGCDRDVVVLVVIWSVCAQVQLAYAVTLGTLEEQMFYPLVVTAVPSVAVAAAVLLHRGASARPLLLGWLPHRLAVVLLSAGLAVAAVADTAVWARIHTTRDDAYSRFLDWAQGSLPPTSRVVATDESTQFVLDTQVIRLETGRQTRQFRAQYVVVVTELLDQGYSKADADLLEIIRQGTLVFEAKGRSVGALRVYDVTAALARPPRVTTPERR